MFSFYTRTQKSVELCATKYECMPVCMLLLLLPCELVQLTMIHPSSHAVYAPLSLTVALSLCPPRPCHDPALPRAIAPPERGAS